VPKLSSIGWMNAGPAQEGDHAHIYLIQSATILNRVCFEPGYGSHLPRFADAMCRLLCMGSCLCSVQPDAGSESVVLRRVS
jgi:hypothetical protein